MAPDWVSHIHFCSPTHLLSHLVFSLLCSFCLSTKLYLQPFDYITHQWRGCMWGNRRNAVARSHPSLSPLVSEHLVYAALHRRQCRGRGYPNDWQTIRAPHRRIAVHPRMRRRRRLAPTHMDRGYAKPCWAQSVGRHPTSDPDITR